MKNSKTPAEVLQETFQYPQFRAGQLEVIEHLLQSRSAAAVFPTGGGKSICYQLPALMLDGLTLVVSPLIALMKDQIDALTARGVSAQRLDSSLTTDEYRQVMDDIRNGTLKILYVAPERFNNERFRASLENIRISLFAIDEAHCISEWGHNFRPDYLKLANYAKSLKAERVLALTATATKAVLNDIRRVFDISEDCVINTGFYRSNLRLLAQNVSLKERDQCLLELLKSGPSGPAIVYVTLQKTAETVAKLLSDAGLPSRHYHAGLKEEARTAVQNWFIESDSAIVVATIAFGMGIDKADIRSVYHYNLPKSLENYSQEIGRAGRDGDDSVCTVLAATPDLIPLENFIYGDTPTRSAIDTFVTSIFSNQDDFDISQYELSNRCDIRQLVLRTLLTGLELKGYLTAGTPFYENYQFKFLQSEASILVEFNEQRREFLQGVFKCAVRKKIWNSIDLSDASRQLGEDRQRLVKALDYLEEKGLIAVKVAGVRYRYRIDQRPESDNDLVDELYLEATQRESREIGRLHEVMDWLQLDECQSSALAARFDSPLGRDCGHCSWCESGSRLLLSERSESAIKPDELAAARDLQQRNPDVLPSSIEVTRVLCGVSSPAISKARLQRSEQFGKLVHLPYPSVLAAVSGFLDSA